MVKKRQLLNLLSLLIIIVTLPIGVYLVRQRQILRSQAAETPTSKLEIIGDKIKDGRTSSRNVQVKLTYVPAADNTYPTDFRLANSVDELASSQDQPFNRNGEIVDWVLSSGNGQRSVFAQFKVKDIYGSPVYGSVTLEGQRPQSQFQTGVETSGILNYGKKDLFPLSKSEDIDSDLKEVQRMRGSIIRVFVGNYKVSTAESSKRLSDFLDKAATYKISVIASFINDSSDFGLYPAAIQSYYTQKEGNKFLLNDTFFKEGYKVDFKNFVSEIVKANKDKPNLYAWEIGNELKTSDPDTMINFMRDITATIKNIDSTHPVATGLGSAIQSGILPLVLYTKLANIDIITIHSLDSDHSGVDDVTWAVQNGKIAILEEVGFSKAGRPESLSKEISFWKTKGVSAVIQKGFLAKGMGDNGNGDKTYGMDTIFHDDYDGIFNVYLNTENVQVAAVAASPSPSPTPSFDAKFDLNKDGKVDSSDINLFRELWIKGSNDKSADFNGDGVINVLDYVLLRKAVAR